MVSPIGMGQPPGIRNVPLTTYKKTGSLKVFLTQFSCISQLNRCGVHLVATLREVAADALTTILRGPTLTKELILALR